MTTGALAVGLLAALPALVEDGLLQKRWAVAAALFAFDGASALFGVLSKLAIAFFQATLGAVPVLTFEAVESHGKVGLPPPPPQTPPPTPPPTRSSLQPWHDFVNFINFVVLLVVLLLLLLLITVLAILGCVVQVAERTG